MIKNAIERWDRGGDINPDAKLLLLLMRECVCYDTNTRRTETSVVLFARVWRWSGFWWLRSLKLVRIREKKKKNGKNKRVVSTAWRVYFACVWGIDFSRAATAIAPPSKYHNSAFAFGGIRIVASEKKKRKEKSNKRTGRGAKKMYKVYGKQGVWVYASMMLYCVTCRVFTGSRRPNSGIILPKYFSYLPESRWFLFAKYM